MTARQAEKGQIDKNYEAFKGLVRELIQTHPGKFALMHDAQLVDIFDTFSDALKYGNRVFGAGTFSVQEITLRPVDLGWYGHAMHNAAV